MKKEESGLGKSTNILAVVGKLIGSGTKLIKLFLAAATFASYSILLSWKFAALIMLAIGVHESGHVYGMKKMGIKTKGFAFIPLLGGVAVAEEQYKTYAQHAFVAMLGPIFGLALAAMAALVYFITNQPLFAVAAAWMSVINLFNLLPINPLDGGQIMRTITFSVSNVFGKVFLFLSLGLACFVAYKFRIGLFLFLIPVAILDLIFVLYEKSKSDFNYYSLSKRPKPMYGRQIFLTVASYLLCLIALFVILFATSGVPGSDIALKFLQD
jgi:putative peptide zinc metalloprotease protein